MLLEHVRLEKHKAVSYLPLSTVVNVLGIPAAAYVSMIKNLGNRYAIFSAEKCCIKSGAIYAYNQKKLSAILKEHRHILSRNGWPTSPSRFVNKIASEWLEQDHPILPVIRAVFGDQD